MKKLLLFLLILNTAYSQRKIPYPIIFIHGLNNNDGAWISNLKFLKQNGLNVDIDYSRYSEGGAGTGSRLSYCLNADGDEKRSILNRNDGLNGYYGDVREFAPALDETNDVFVVNFGVGDCYGSNQSAIVKQGFALGLAVKRVLEATKAHHVILVGHSMGGLAIREYLTTRENWVNKYGGHQVAHFVTIGTPHGGSNSTTSGFLDNEYSEAVRDLKKSYVTGRDGVYLFGGYENNRYMKPNLLNFDNLDVNCNGILGEFIQGLNSKQLPSDVTLSCIIGKYIDNDYLNLHGDGIVTEQSQYLLNYQNPLPFIHNKLEINAIHSKAIGFMYPRALVEQDYYTDIFAGIQFAYVYGQVEIPLNKAFTGAFVNRLNESSNFSNTYKFFVFKGGKLKLHANNPYGFHNIQVVNRDKTEIIIPYVNGDNREYTLPVGGNYMIIFTSKFFTKGVQVYNFQTEYCQFPDAPVFEANITNICQGEQAVLTAPMGFDSYIWYRDGTEIQKGAANSAKVDKSGVYSMQAYGCGTNVVSYNKIEISVKPLPDKPTVIVTSEGLKSSSITGNQWYLDGQAIEGANQQILATYGSGNYSVKTTNLGCSNESSSFVINSTEDNNLQTKLYPNPTNGVVNLILSQGKQQLSIIDFSGKVLYNKEILIDNSPYRLDCSFLNSGEYILKIETTTNVRTFKFFIL